MYGEWKDPSVLLGTIAKDVGELVVDEPKGAGFGIGCAVALRRLPLDTLDEFVSWRNVSRQVRVTGNFQGHDTLLQTKTAWGLGKRRERRGLPDPAQDG